MNARAERGEHRTAQISPDRLTVGFFAISLVVIVMSSSMVFSYVGIAEAAAWTGVPFGIHVIAPIFIDGAIITYTVSLTIFEWRREDPKTIRHTKRVLRGFTALSVGLNFAHTASFWQWDFTAYEAWFGALISISAPIAALLSAEEVVRLAFRRRPLPVTADQPAEAAPAKAPEPSPEPTADAPSIPVHPAIVQRPPVILPPPPPDLGEVAAGSEPDVAEVVAEAERLIHSLGELDSADSDDDGIVRYPVQGEFLLRTIDPEDAHREV